MKRTDSFATPQILYFLSTYSIAYLVPLKRTLTQLDISNNVRLTDDCCSSLCYLTGLKSLDIFQTGISITGLRRLVRDMPSSSSIDVNLTTACHEYLSGTLPLLLPICQ